MKEKEEVYTGFWQQFGCVLSVIAILGVISLMVMGLYFFFTGA